MKVLELFAGSRSIGKIAEELGMDVFSSDINPFEKIDYVVDILNFKPTEIPFTPDIIWASPPCTTFSVASIGHHWDKDGVPKTAEAILGLRIALATVSVIKYFNPKYYFIENPRGKLRTISFMRELPRTTVMYCQYGDDRMKPTDIWSNNLYSMTNPSGFTAKTCFNGNKNCHHQPAPRGSRTGTQGRDNAYDRSIVPQQLCIDILKSCMQ